MKWCLVAHVVAVVTLHAPLVRAQEWSRFRGPNGAGVGRSDHIPASWSEKDYNWKIALAGIGHSSPVIWKNRLFATSGDASTGACIVEAIDTISGDRVWQRRFDIAVHPKHQLNSFASPTPVLASGRLFLCWGNPEELVVLALGLDGRQLWRRRLGTFRSGHGFGVSPIAYNDVVVLPVEHQGDSALFALSQADGTTRWKIDRDSQLHYATPCLYRHNGQDSLIFSNWKTGISALDPANGALLWAGDVFDKSHIESSIASPVVTDRLVIAVCGWLGHGNEVIAVRPIPRSTEVEQVWRITRGAPLCCTPLVHNGWIFLWTDNGIATCADVKTGEIQWRHRVGGTFFASPICAAGRLYNTSVEGKVVVVAADSKFKLLASNNVGEGSHSTAAVADGVLYLRTFSHLISLGGQRSRP